MCVCVCVCVCVCGEIVCGRAWERDCDYTRVKEICVCVCVLGGGDSV